MNVDPMVIIMAILALGVLAAQAYSAARLRADFDRLSYLAQWAIEHVPPPTAPPAGQTLLPYSSSPAMPGDVRFHFPSILFPERPESSGTTTLT